MNLFDQNVPGLAALLQGQGAPAEQPTPVQGMADIVQPAQAPAAAPAQAAPEAATATPEPPAEEKSAKGLFSSPEVRNMLMYGLMGFAKSGDIGTAMQSAVIAGAGTRHEQERLRKETEDRELAKRKTEQDMALRQEEMGLRKEDMGLRREELGMKRENYASERDYRAAQAAKTRSETTREEDLHATTKAGLQGKIDFIKEQIATSKDARKTEALKRRQMTLENSLREFDVEYAPRVKEAQARGLEIGNEGAQIGNAGKITANRGAEIKNEGAQIENAKSAQEYEKNAMALEAYRSAPESQRRMALMGLKGTAAKSEEGEFLKFVKDHQDQYYDQDGNLDLPRVTKDYNQLKAGGLSPEHQLKLKEQARNAVPVGSLYTDPVTGNTYRRNK